MRDCPACGEHLLCHLGGGWRCLECDYASDAPKGGYQQRRDQRRYKRVLRRIDKIGQRLANVRW